MRDVGRNGCVVVWTDETVGRLVRLAIDEGLSAASIAEQIPGATRNAIIGKAGRLGIKLGGGLVGRRPAISFVLRPTVPKSRVGQGVRRKSTKVLSPPRARKEDGSLPPLPVLMPPSLEGFPGIAIEALTDSVCHWPHGDPHDLEVFRYCGAPVSYRKYCPYHSSVAYVPRAQPKAEREEKRCLETA